MATEIASYQLPNGRSLKLLHGDLTEQAVDALVNAANQALQHGGGLAAAIVRAGGQTIQDESNHWVQQHGPVSHDQPAVTGAGDLPAQYVIHAVGPRWGEGDEDRKLSQAVTSALQAADELNVTSLALPPISTGTFGFPKGRAAALILDAVEGFDADQPESSLQDIRLTIIDEETLQPFRAEFADRTGGA